MKRDTDSHPESWESDPVWELLKQSPSPEAGPTFVNDVVRAARLLPRARPWWPRFALRLTLGSFATAAAAVFAIMVAMQQPDAQTPGAQIVAAGNPALDALDEALRTEALLVAADYPADFTDADLVALIAY